jgi:AraC-like DNA-binding protein
LATAVLHSRTNTLVQSQPAGQVDPLSDVFSRVRMTGAAFFRVVSNGPSVAEQLPCKTTLATMLGRTRHLIPYYVVTEGRCFVRLVDGAAVEVRAGQIVMFPKGDQHVISSEPGVPVDPALQNMENWFTPAEMRYGAEAAGENLPAAKMLCGFLACDSRPFNPLIENLPSILIGDCAEGFGLPSVRELIHLAIEESGKARVGGQTVLGRLAELMFIEVVRQHVERLPAGNRTWLSGLRDQPIGRAIAFMHGDPRRCWSLNELAREVGLSRSEFAERFTTFIGVPPMQYLARWRMQAAAELLRDSVNIASIANEVGYSCEASFSRAFKKIVGVPPSRWREDQELLAA